MKNTEFKNTPEELFYMLQSDFSPVYEKGVYAICVRNHMYDSGGEHVLYVGSSKKVNKRIQNHNHPYLIALQRFTDSLVYVKSCALENNIEVESILIRHCNPILNKNGKFKNIKS